MLVKVLNFGSNWWARFGSDADDPDRLTRHAAYYNSTGIRCGSKVRRHWQVPGLLRFNGVGDFNARRPKSLLGHTFHCSDLAFAFGGNRLLFERKATQFAVPDCYLVVFNSLQHGPVNFSSSVWKSPSTRVIAASSLRLVQEIMVLMLIGNWVATAWGFWQLLASDTVPGSVALELVGAPDQAEVR
jgi:hypothetical protein